MLFCIQLAQFASHHEVGLSDGASVSKQVGLTNTASVKSHVSQDFLQTSLSGPKPPKESVFESHTCLIFWSVDAASQAQSL